MFNKSSSSSEHFPPPPHDRRKNLKFQTTKRNKLTSCTTLYVYNVYYVHRGHARNSCGNWTCRRRRRVRINFKCFCTSFHFFFLKKIILCVTEKYVFLTETFFVFQTNERHASFDDTDPNDYGLGGALVAVPVRLHLLITKTSKSAPFYVTCYAYLHDNGLKWLRANRTPDPSVRHAIILLSLLSYNIACYLVF